MWNKCSEDPSIRSTKRATHVDADAHAHAHAHTRAHSLVLNQMCKTHKHMHTHMRSHMRTHICTCTHAYASLAAQMYVFGGGGLQQLMGKLHKKDLLENLCADE